MLSGETNRTHFLTVTAASRNAVAAWSVRPGEGDISKAPSLPVRSPRRKGTFQLTIPLCFSSLL